MSTVAQATVVCLTNKPRIGCKMFQPCSQPRKITKYGCGDILQKFKAGCVLIKVSNNIPLVQYEKAGDTPQSALAITQIDPILFCERNGLSKQVIDHDLMMRYGRTLTQIDLRPACPRKLMLTHRLYEKHKDSSVCG